MSASLPADAPADSPAGCRQERLPEKRQRRWRLIATLAALPAILWVLDAAFPPALPDQAQLFARVVTDRHGEPLRAFPDARGVWRYPIRPDAVSPRYLEALLTYEDRHFWRHPGVNPVAFARALWQGLREGRLVSGGSTLTMQVARLLHPQPRSLGGKLAQILRALQLEWRLDKTEILTLYLNLAPFGGIIEGVEAAAWAYLDKPARELTPAEAALLAVLPQSPSRFRPDRHPQRARAARDKVLDRMARLGVWSSAVVDDARQEPVVARRLDVPRVAPLLAERLVRANPDAAVIRSTLEGDLQRRLEAWMRNHLSRLPAQASAAVLVVDNRDRSVLAYLGSAAFGSRERHGFLDMVSAPRSPGSTLKPFLFALGIEHGLIHAQSLLADVPRTGSRYRPGNFTGGFSGPVSATEALQRSLNLPAVALLERFGPQRFVDHLRHAGLPLSIPGDETAGLAVILGGAGMRLEHLVAGYAALASDGQVTQLRLLPDTPPSPRYFTAPGSAWITWRTLADTRQPDQPETLQARREARTLAWKTGTSYGFRDAWAIGSSARHTVGVWVGRPDGTPMPGHFGALTAAPLMHQVFRQLPHEDYAEPARPAGVGEETICWPLGLPAERTPAGHCAEPRTAWILDHTVPPTWSDGPNPVTIWVDPATGLRVNPGCTRAPAESRTVALWPASLEPWLPGQRRRHSLIPELAPWCTEDTPLWVETPRIRGLEEGSRLTPPLDGSTWPLATFSALGGLGELTWYVNGEPRYISKANQPVQHTFDRPGRHEVVVIDAQGQMDRRVVMLDRPGN